MLVDGLWFDHRGKWYVVCRAHRDREGRLIHYYPTNVYADAPLAEAAADKNDCIVVPVVASRETVSIERDRAEKARETSG